MRATGSSVDGPVTATTIARPRYNRCDSMVLDRALVVDRLRQRLLSGAGTAGWGYYAGKSSRLEPTCWALLALGASWDGAPPHLAFLSARQSADGLLVETEPAFANFTSNGLASIVLAQFAPRVPQATRARLHAGLVAAKGVRISARDPKQNNQLQGWPWVRDTFSWVEPTAWCLLALKRVGPGLATAGSEAREQEAEKLLVNRVCTTGGWNYGNASALGQDLRAYVPTTAVGLLSLQDRRALTAVQQSLRFLMDERLNEPSAMTLALTALCLRIYGQSVDDVEERLAQAVLASEQSGNLHAVAMALYALSADQHNVEAFCVGA